MGNPKVLVTGAAGFIGFHLCDKLLKLDYQVVGMDNMNDYYDVNLKKARLEALPKKECFQFIEIDLCDKKSILDLFESHKFDYVINLAAQAGVRYSLTHPDEYISNNVQGFLNILEGCRYHDVKHLIYASSSSVYGGNTAMPFSVHQNVDHPVSLYAATKKSNELMAHTYSHLFGLPTSGLRFFTVYGPYGRPDMALFLFTKAIIEGKSIDVFNEGRMKRDFTYVEDIVEGIARLIPVIPQPDDKWDKDNPDSATSWAPYRLFNIGNNNPVELMEYITTLEECLGKKAIKNLLPLQPGDVLETYADVQDLADAVGFKPQTSLKYGIQKFVDWYVDYYKVKI
ncbi:NAD-dependent epimerase [Fulvivirga maritima]|uniref:NAD-dependent epimerase n=1 Tax=Fulvivirga maritima TaxID=2904247 RepID=UPI001F32FEED|nr:NAD-dependent epimerase [Fulvivirga maritima]UII27956.1 NAD-dependent epimerase [Fulvivirga maritima]